MSNIELQISMKSEKLSAYFEKIKESMENNTFVRANFAQAVRSINNIGNITDAVSSGHLRKSVKYIEESYPGLKIEAFQAVINGQQLHYGFEAISKAIAQLCKEINPLHDFLFVDNIRSGQGIIYRSISRWLSSQRERYIAKQHIGILVQGVYTKLLIRKTIKSLTAPEKFKGWKHGR